jgi:hypothetical protein
VLEFDALELLSLQAASSIGSYIKVPAGTSKAVASRRHQATGVLPASCIAVTQRDGQWAAHPAAGDKGLDRWSIWELGCLVDQRLQAAITSWSSAPELHHLVVKYITDLCQAPLRDPACDLHTIMASLLGFAEALPFTSFPPKAFSTSMPFLLSLRALHQKGISTLANKNGGIRDPNLQALVLHLAQKLGLSNPDGLFMPASSWTLPSAFREQPLPAPPAPPAKPGPPAPANNTPPPAAGSKSATPDEASQPAPTPVAEFSELAKLLATAPHRADHEWDVDCDLGGRTLVGGTEPLIVPKRRRVRIRNGSLRLPLGGHVKVGPSAVLQLDSIHLSGPGNAASNIRALLLVRGDAARAVLNTCTITVTDNRPYDQGANGMLVDQGGSADLKKCVITGAALSGLMVSGCNSMATATNCTAQQCSNAGFQCRSKGVLNVDGCTASNNKGTSRWSPEDGHGFLASWGAVMNVGAKCTAQRNNGNGFRCEDGSKMVIQQGCSALDNDRSGFLAQGPSARMEVGLGCRAYNNNNNGFLAKGGCIKIEGGADSSFNTLNGFLALGMGAHLVAGPGCIAARNRGEGWSAGDGGRLEGQDNIVLCGNECHARWLIKAGLILFMLLYVIMTCYHGR